MKFTFAPWLFGGESQGAEAIANFLRERAAEPPLSKLIQIQGSPNRKIHFLVVDVMPSACASDSLETALAKLFLPNEPRWREELGKPISRFLFVGATSALDEWEVEDKDKSKPLISIKKAVEFYIRALQNAELAHYGKGGPDMGALSNELAISALVGLARYYDVKKCLRPLSAEIEEVRQQTARIFEHARDHHDFLIDLDVGAPESERNSDLLLSLNAVIQLGKRNPIRAHEHAAFMRLTPDRPTADAGSADAGIATPGRPSSYGLWTDLDRALADWGRQGAPADIRATIQIADLSFGLQRYNLMRDLARCIGTGAVPSLRAARKKRLRRKDGVLIIDDRLWAEMDEPARKDALADRIRNVLALIEWDGIAFVAKASAFEASEATDPLRDDEGLQNGIEVRPLNPQALKAKANPRPEDFALILVEVDSMDRFLGPRLVHRIASYLRKAVDSKRTGRQSGTRGAKRSVAPPIIVLTRTESFGHVQQSLNFGAVAYVLKDRLYQLPYQMNHALQATIGSRDDTPYASSFRALHALRPEIKAKLHTTRGTGFVYGGRIYNDEDGWQVLADHREQLWIRELPKADLHCHLGTCIHYSVIHALALNTVGHLLPGKTLKSENVQVQAAVDRGILAVLLAAHFHGRTKGSIPPLVCLGVAAAALAEKEPDEAPMHGIGDQIVLWLNRKSEKVERFETASLIAATIGWTDDHAGAGAPRPDPPPPDSLAYLDSLAVLEKVRRGSDRRSAENKTKHNRERARDFAADCAIAQILRIAKLPRFKANSAFAKLSDARYPWRTLSADVRQRIEGSRSKLEIRHDELWRNLANPQAAFQVDRKDLDRRITKAAELFRVEALAQRSGSAAPRNILEAFRLPEQGAASPARLTIQHYVELPRQGKNHTIEHGLMRYLWGADLLGAEHLQYPENLVLAAFALTRDNAMDNVTYSEVRCETPGYCKGGMSKKGATDLLCLSFDLASLVIANQQSKPHLPLVRTNVLLAAKRHKGADAAREVVGLLKDYLDSSSSDDRYARCFPEGWWWQPCRIVGFDLSGDESQDPKWLEEILADLAKLSSPITVHAGEAATVESIKNAIHRHHARRIGHGLRLRADPVLQDYCVREGICMEMCPNSNIFTNAYYPSEDGDFEQADAHPANDYPLLAYMEEGLEVCLATDNRYLHRQGSQTLTSEFMTAARLSFDGLNRGLTRWEILQLVKAGFKNAFLPKQEVKALVSAMEERVYRMISRGWF